MPKVPGGKPRGLSLKAACQVSSQATACMIKMFPDDRPIVAFEWNTALGLDLPYHLQAEADR